MMTPAPILPNSEVQMPLDPNFLRYPMLRKGMDHDLYPAANMFEQPKVTVAVEFFPLTPNDGPFRAAGHMATPFPDFRTFTARDYGNRIAIYRIMDALTAASIPATAFVSSALIDRTPKLLQDIQSAGWEIAAHGEDMNNIHYGDMPLDVEQRQIEACLAAAQTCRH